MDIFYRFKNDSEFVLAIHIFVHVGHFRKLLAKFPWNSEQDWIQWSLLEATLIKSRAISEFLSCDKNSGVDNFCANNLVPNWVSPADNFSPLRKLVNKHVAHFSSKRFLGSSDFEEISLNDIENELKNVELEFARFEKEFMNFNSILYNDILGQIRN
jgi:hypothetical protein